MLDWSKEVANSELSSHGSVLKMELLRQTWWRRQECHTLGSRDVRYRRRADPVQSRREKIQAEYLPCGGSRRTPRRNFSWMHCEKPPVLMSRRKYTTRSDTYTEPLLSVLPPATGSSRAWTPSVASPLRDRSISWCI